MEPSSLSSNFKSLFDFALVVDEKALEIWPIKKENKICLANGENSVCALGV